MNRIVLPMAALALFAATTMRCPAQENNAAADASKPVAVLSIASYDRVMADIAMLGNLAGNPDLDKNLEGMLQLFTQGQGLVGLDKKRPWCISLTTDGISFQPLVYLPVDDLEALLDALAGLLGEADDVGDGLYELNVFGQPILVKQKGAWTVIGQDADAISAAPNDPATLLNGMDTAYDIGVRLYVQNIPEVYRSLAIDGLRMGVDSGLSQLQNEDDAEYEARREIIESQLDVLTDMINDIDQITLGVAVDLEAVTAHIDLSISAVPGSKSAKQLGRMKPIASEFAGFLSPDAAASLNVTSEIAKEDAQQIVSALAAIRSRAEDHIENESKLTDDGSKKLAKEMLAEVFDAIDATLESGKIDAAATLNLNDDTMALVVGAYIADPQALDSALKKFAKLAEKEPDFPGIKFDADSHEGVRFHTISIPVPEDKGIAKILGGKLDVAVGIGAKAVYFALGTDSLALTKELIDKSKAASDKVLPPFQLNVSLAPIFKFAAAMQDEEKRETVLGLAEELAKSEGKDKVSLVVMPDEGGITIRLEAEEGVLRLLANAGKMITAAGGFPGAP